MQIEGEVALSPLYGVFTPTNQHVGLMIEAYFESPERAQAFLSPLCQKGAKNTLQITNTTFLTGRLQLPKEEGEQHKIADCLASVDALIAARRRKVEALRAHKKGLMQQLFPQEGETQPRRRFPEFGDDWHDGKLETLCVGVSSGKDQRNVDGVFDLYGSTGIIGKTEHPSYYAPHILVARVGANAGQLTRATGQYGVTDNTLVISLKSSVKMDFVFYCLENMNINKLVFGSGQPLITGTILKHLQMLFPGVREQQRIVDCISSLDDLIAAETRKLDMLKTHKKGLMQQLFPQVGEAEA